MNPNKWQKTICNKQASTTVSMLSSWLDLVGELEIYVDYFHPGGLKWNI